MGTYMGVSNNAGRVVIVEQWCARTYSGVEIAAEEGGMLRLEPFQDQLHLCGGLCFSYAPAGKGGRRWNIDVDYVYALAGG